VLKLVTRAQLGWPASAAPTQTSTLGVKVHYEGTEVSTRLLTDHTACIAEWKAIRASHLANTQENYSDIAYNYGACPHGYLLEGRGIGKRTGANGNQALNQAHYAIVGLVGSSGLTQPTEAMLSAIRDGIDLLRKNGAGSEIKGHRDGYATACPGAALYAWVQKGAPPPPPPPPPEDDMALTDADAQKVAEAVWAKALASPTAPAGTSPLRTAGTFLRWSDQHHAELIARLAALTTAVQALATGGGLDAAEITAAAEAGARAALAELGDALTN
jgi:hypothetical protein